MGGTYWYHAHFHGSNGENRLIVHFYNIYLCTFNHLHRYIAVQVGGGAVGLLIVNDLAGDIPEAVANMPEVLMMIQLMDLAK